MFFLLRKKYIIVYADLSNSNLALQNFSLASLFLYVFDRSNLGSAHSGCITLTQFQGISGLQVAHLCKRETFIREG